MPHYQPDLIEPKWQLFWEEQRTFATPELPAGEKMYVLDMFPYPSAAGLHVGHPEGYTATDIVCRYQRMRGVSVLHPMGFDSFGLPAEEAAIKTGVHPRVNTEKNIANFRRQLKMLGFSYDWQREVATTDVAYTRWTQWIFLQIFNTWFDPEQQKGRPIGELPIPPEVQSAGEAAVRKYQDDRRLAYQSEVPVNWCPALGTVLANEEVINGLSERGGHPVQRLPLCQWMLRITAYAQRLEEDLELIQWPEHVKTLQRNWIGRSTGAELDFYIGSKGKIRSGKPFKTAFEEWASQRTSSGFPSEAPADVLRVYTTRPDTLFGATYMVIAPEHPFVQRLTTPAYQDQVTTYCQKAVHKSDLERTELAKTKTGVFTGSFAINPVNGQAVPIWVADYVLAGYGTGAIMAVPSGDERDFEFAQKFDLPVVAVVDPGEGYQDKNDETITREAVLKGEACFSGQGVAVNSGPYDGTPTAECQLKMTEALEAQGVGRGAVNYKLRDWLFSRQRFWGEPFPLLHELDSSGQATGSVRGVPEDQLPVELPHLDDFQPHGRPEPMLAKAPEQWQMVTLEGTRYRRELNTMPQWAGSCWYYLRYIDPHNKNHLVDPEKERAWMPVDLYVGGVEHAVLHLLYARFWHKVLHDLGHVSSPEPFHELVNPGMILGEIEFAGYQQGGSWISASEVTENADQPGVWMVQQTGQPVARIRLAANQVQKQQDRWTLAETPEIEVAGLPHFEGYWQGGTWISAAKVQEKENAPGVYVLKGSDQQVHRVQLASGQAEKSSDNWVLAENPEIRIEGRAYKMSKSRGNVVNPDDIVHDFGADALRLYEMFLGPLEQKKPWSTAGVSGVRGFLDRAWRMIVDSEAEQMAPHPAISDQPCDEEQRRVLHRTIKALTEAIQSKSFNIGIAKLMEFCNYFGKLSARPREAMEAFTLLLSPFAPHMAEELWQTLGHDHTLAYHPWPEFNEDYIRESSIEIPVQVNGKLRGTVQVPAEASREEMVEIARADERIIEFLEGKQLIKEVAVPGRVVSFVVK